MIEATGKAGTSIKPDGKGGIGQGFTVCQHTATKQGTGDRRKPSRSGSASRLPLAPRARLHDLARAFQNCQGNGTSERNPALGVLAVWLDGDRSHGQAGTSINPDGKAGIGQGFNGLAAHRHPARHGRPAQAFTV